MMLNGLPLSNSIKPDHCQPAAIHFSGPLMLAPGERREYRLELGILDGADAIDAFRASLPT